MAPRAPPSSLSRSWKARWLARPVRDRSSPAGEARAVLGVGDGDADELGEAREPRLGVVGQTSRLLVDGGERTPRDVPDDDRREHHRPPAEAVGEGARGLVRRRHGPARLPGAREVGAGRRAHPRAGAELDPARRPPRAEDLRLVAVEADEAGGGRAEQPARLLGHDGVEPGVAPPVTASVATRSSDACRVASATRPAPTGRSGSASSAGRRPRAAGSRRSRPRAPRRTSAAGGRRRRAGARGSRR